MEPSQLELPLISSPKKLVETLWGSFPSHSRLFNGDSVSGLCHDAYFEYYERHWGLIVANCEGKFVALKTRASVNRLVQDLQSNRSRSDLLEELEDSTEGSAARDACENTINLAARLLVMMAIGPIKYQFRSRPSLIWTEGSLKLFVSQHFSEPQAMNPEGVKLPKTFNAWSLEKIGGFEITFTDNLSDHLRLDEDSKLYIFHYVSFLECQRLKG
jgi:hypothetical protein